MKFILNPHTVSNLVINQTSIAVYEIGERRFEALSADRYQQVWDNIGPERALALYQGFPDLRNLDTTPAAMPALLVSGSQSPAIFRLLITELSKRLPNVRKALIDTRKTHTDCATSSKGR